MAVSLKVLAVRPVIQLYRENRLYPEELPRGLYEYVRTMAGMTTSAAAKLGLDEMFAATELNKDPWCERTAAIIAENGNLELLKWVRARGCHWDARTCAYAARGGHLEILQWARSEGCPWDSWTYVYATQSHHELLKWVISRNCPGTYEPISYQCAIL